MHNDVCVDVCVMVSHGACSLLYFMAAAAAASTYQGFAASRFAATAAAMQPVLRRTSET
jgi:hypothetical protein